MKRIFLLLTAVLLTAGFAQAQTHNITGSVIDTTKQTVPGTTVKLKTDKGDSTTRVTGMDGKFTFSNINATKVTLTITSVGYQGVVKHFTFTNDNKPLEVGAVILKSMSTLLKGVTVVGVTPVTLKEDTTVYNAAAYKVRDNAPTEDLVRKLPGVDVDADGNITTKGKQVTKVRINGKDVFGGDLQSITKNLPADVVESIQMIDDYGDQANLTGVKTGDPTQVMNITIRKDKNYGYSANITGGDGRDALPTPPATTANPNPADPNDNRYVGLINAFKFKGDQQLYLLGNLNNVNANTFSFGGTGGGGGGGNRGGGGGNGGGGNGGGGNGGGGGGNRGGGSSTTPNGISDVHTAGFNYRDQWGKNLSVYGSYSFADNSVYTVIGKSQSNNSGSSSGTQTATNSIETDKNVNHRFTWNMEWKPDTVNYIKFTPTFSYTSTRANYSDSSTTAAVTSANAQPVITNKYRSTNFSTSDAPNYGINLLYNHRFNGHGRNFSDYITASSSHSEADQNPIYNYLVGISPVQPNQTISTGSRVNSVNNNLSYLEPLSTSGRSYLEFNYNFSYSHTTSDKYTDFLNSAVNPPVYVNNPQQSNNYVYNFMTNKFSLNYRFVEKKYNYTLGLGVQPSVLDGSSPVTGSTHVSNFNFVPTARYVYNFSRSQAFNATYSGSSNQPTFDQLQPVLDQSNALYPVQGNPNLKPEFNNNFNIRYNQFSFNTGDVLFFNVNYTQTDNKIVTNYVYALNSNVITTKYLNADGYYSSSAYFNYTKPWDNRKFSAGLGGNISYTNNIGYITDGNGNTSQNIGKTLNMSPQFKFRTDFTDVIDAQFITTYTISKTDNSIQNSLIGAGSNVRALQLQLLGKNYFFKNWTFSYDFRRTVNSGYTIPVTNPNILNLYVERRFLKNNMATIRVSGNDLFNQNTGYSVTQTAVSNTQTNTNQLGRYFLLTLNIRLQKFAGKAPDQGNGRGDRMPGERGNRGDRGPGGMGGGGGGFGGPGGPGGE